jgi:hypothetical protein
MRSGCAALQQQQQQQMDCWLDLLHPTPSSPLSLAC